MVYSCRGQLCWCFFYGAVVEPRYVLLVLVRGVVHHHARKVYFKGLLHHPRRHRSLVELAHDMNNLRELLVELLDICRTFGTNWKYKTCSEPGTAKSRRHHRSTTRVLRRERQHGLRAGRTRRVRLRQKLRHLRQADLILHLELLVTRGSTGDVPLLHPYPPLSSWRDLSSYNCSDN